MPLDPVSREEEMQGQDKPSLLPGGRVWPALERSWAEAEGTQEIIQLNSSLVFHHGHHSLLVWEHTWLQG